MSLKRWVILLAVITVCFSTSLESIIAGVSKEIAAQYKLEYENKALFLRIPIRGEAETVTFRGDRIRLNSAADISGLRFRVGEQIRVTSVDFKDSRIEFRISSVDQARQGLVVFQFRQSLTYSFPERQNFDGALKSTFTEGLSYQEIDEAKETFIKNQFDEQVREFVSMAGVSSEFVMKAVAERNPQFESMQSKLSSSLAESESLKQQLQSEQEQNRDSSDEMRSLRTEFNELKNTNSSLTRERDNLTTTQKSMKEENNTLRGENQRFQKQLEDIAGKLNLEADSKSQLGKQVDNLSLRIESLKRERDTLSNQEKSLTRDLTASKEENNQLSKNLQSSERQVKKFRSDLNALTSNRNSLESTFIRTKNAKESLELARKLEKALVVKPRDQEKNGDTVRISDIWLHEHKIGQLEVRLPEGTDQPLVVNFSVDSPDTVQFNDETRNLYQSIGEKFKLQPQWESWSDGLEVALQEGEAVQSVGPREEASWSWNTNGGSSTVQHISFVVHLINEDDHSVLLSRQDFRIAPTSLISGLTSSFSVSSMIIGLLLGFVGIGAVVALRGGGQKGGTKSPRTVKKQIRKEL